METPKNKIDYRATRNPTPRLSERKKKLFHLNKDNENILNEDDDLEGITPLEPNQAETPKSRSIEKMLKGKLNRTRESLSFLSGESESDYDNPSPTRRSLRLTQKSNSPGNKENENMVNADEQQLQQLFNTSLTLKNTKSLKTYNKSSGSIGETSEEEEINDDSNLKTTTRKENPKSQKRYLSSPKNNDVIQSPNKKVPKLASTAEARSIPAKAFYSAPSSAKSDTTAKASILNKHITPKVSPKARRSLGINSSNINRGVKHKIRRRIINSQSRHQKSVDIDLILHNLRNEKLRNLITSKREEREQIEKIHNIFRQAENPIEMARPLSVISNDDKNNNNVESDRNSSKPEHFDLDIDTGFSDIDYESDLDNSNANDKSFGTEKEQVIPMITHKMNPNKSKEENAEPSMANRKFFKSKRTNVMEVRITDNIRASVCNGKIQLVEQKKPKRTKPRSRSAANEFSDEQATVDAILKSLDDTTFGDLIPPGPQCDDAQTGTDDIEDTPESLQQLEAITNDFLTDIQLEDSTDYADFRNRLPYKTSNPQVIDQQHLLLDFLISNNICTEENFQIFIADPDNHREDAARILDNLVVVLNEEQMKFRDRIPYNTNDPKLIEQQQNFLYFLMENDICNEENFDIFIANYDKRQSEADAIIAEIQAKDCKYAEALNNPENRDQIMGSETLSIRSDDSIPLPADTMETPLVYHSNEEETITDMSIVIPNQSNNSMELPSIPIDHIHNFSPTIVPEKNDKEKYYPIFYPEKRTKPLPVQKSTRRTGRTWQGGFGATQMQIDAGQKEFGATQCKQCGLLYTVHEAEEEKLHREFHASLHILRFKGWIDEDIVAIYPEWGHDGRIIRLTNTSYPKRKERLIEILKIVDKELGFSSYIMPDVFVAYLAVRKSQIVGVCLVQPLNEANKYLCIDNVDCCSLDAYEAKCGISRIWVSPLHRRCHIASKLINAVQFNTIVGEDIPLEKIAFSAPTEMGRKFAQKVTRMENFLVY